MLGPGRGYLCDFIVLSLQVVLNGMIGHRNQSTLVLIAPKERWCNSKLEANYAVEDITLESSCRKTVKGLFGFRFIYFDEIQEAFIAVPCSTYSASLINSVQESETIQCECLNRSTRSKQKEEVFGAKIIWATKSQKSWAHRNLERKQGVDESAPDSL